MNLVNITIIVASCDDSELAVKAEYEECEVAKLLNDPSLSLLKPYVEQLLDMGGEYDQSTDPST